MSDIQELSQKLRTEVLRGFDPRIPTERFNDAVNTLNFLMMVYAIRGDMSEVTVSVRFMQFLCELGRDGFEAASGSRYQNERQALANLLDKIWQRFTDTLMLWVREQLKDAPNPRALWYSCFEVPAWFIQTVQEDTERRNNLLR